MSKTLVILMFFGWGADHETFPITTVDSQTCGLMWDQVVLVWAFELQCPSRPPFLRKPRRCENLAKRDLIEFKLAGWRFTGRSISHNCAVTQSNCCCVLLLRPWLAAKRCFDVSDTNWHPSSCEKVEMPAWRKHHHHKDFYGISS